MKLKTTTDTKAPDIVFVDQEHCERVAELSYLIARLLSLDKDKCNDILLAGKYHDVGKAYLAKSILDKPGRLTDLEMEHVKFHSLYSAAVAIEKGFNSSVIRYIYHHHENFNGSGYPTGLRDRDIPIGARIIRIADFYDALTSDRVYRPKYQSGEAIDILKRNKHLLDPDILCAFISYAEKRILSCIKNN